MANITHVPGDGNRGRCTSHSFSAKISVRGKPMLRRVQVFVNGKLIKQTTHKEFRVWVKVRGLRHRNTIRVVAVDVNGRRDVARESFRRCASAAPNPDFTG